MHFSTSNIQFWKAENNTRDYKNKGIRTCIQKSFPGFMYIIPFLALFVIFSVTGCVNNDTVAVEWPIPEDNIETEVTGEQENVIDPNHSDALFVSRKFVIESLEEPQSAKFSPFIADVSKQPDNIYSVKSYVDLQKNCGGIVRKHYVCTLKLKKAKWSLENLEFY